MLLFSGTIGSAGETGIAEDTGKFGADACASLDGENVSGCGEYNGRSTIKGSGGAAIKEYCPYTI